MNETASSREWTLTTAPTVEPITLAEAKAQLRQDHDGEDPLILSYIAAARQAAEEWLGRGLLTQTWTLTCEGFTDVIWLPMAAPLQSVTSVKYYDTSHVQQTLATTGYTVDTVSRPGRIVRAAAAVWPTTHYDHLSGAVEIVYKVGWSTPAAVPERIKQGIRLYVGALDADRDGLDGNFLTAKHAAESCWTDRVYLRESC